MTIVNTNLPLLQIENLTIQLKTKGSYFNVISNLSLTVNEGEIVGIVGESGCGKSVLSHSVIDLQPKTMHIAEGDIIYQQHSLRKRSKEERRKLRGNEISIIFQDPMSSLNPSLTIGYQLMEVFRLHQKKSKAEARLAAVEVLKKVGLSRVEELLDEYPHHLSGGMQQRVMIAMSIACNPKLLIADEPTTALDVTIQAQILDVMRTVSKQNGTAILLISHDLGVMAEMCDRIMVMYAGEIVETGTAQQLFDNPKHPYTQGLLKSIPTPNKKNKPLYSIKGNVPPLHERKGGCPFVSRCEWAIAKCTEQNPKLENCDNEHNVKCFLHKKVGVGTYEFV
ncbi:ABC transporter ATP-binding protein [Metabacillus fastidiosus]|uniref:ABC transporter ATP-binding protein n=1 Tax=Metabacillus fastidiosus TaxID=1458 RepID=UPI003D29196B